MPLVAGVDSSTQSTKVEIRDSDSGELVGRGRAAHPATRPPCSEQNPEAWWQALGSALAEATVDLAVADVAGISVAAQQHGLVALDESGEVIRPAKLWNDTESAPDAAWLLDQLGGPRPWAEATGSVPVASFTVTKLSWLHRSEPESWARLARACLPHDFLTLRLCGEYVTDRGDASGTGYWSPAGGDYRYDLLAVVDSQRDWDGVLPSVLGPDVAAGRTRRLGLDAIVGAGTGDNMAAALGVGLQPGDVVVSVGTSGTVYARSDVATADASGAVAGFADATGGFLPLVCTLNATKVTDAVARLLGVGLDELDELALGEASGAGDVVLVPYFDGERTPNRPDATGLIAGLRSDVSRAQLARAAFEGVVCGLADGLDALGAAGVDTTGSVYLVGGGSQSKAYPQVAADVLGRAITIPTGDEHVARGACVQAAAVATESKVADVAADWRPAPTVVEPTAGADGRAVRQRYADQARDTSR